VPVNKRCAGKTSFIRAFARAGFVRIRIASFVSPLPEEFLEYLKERYNFYYGYSNTTKSSYYSNHCKHCNVIQGYFFLFEEIESPFFSDIPGRAEKLILHRVKLKNDLIMDADIGYGFADELIKDHGKLVDFGHGFNI